MTPESERERKLLEDPELRAGLAWGSPRWGHPEGTVREHVAQLLARIPQDDAGRPSPLLLRPIRTDDDARIDAAWQRSSLESRRRRMRGTTGPLSRRALADLRSRAASRC